MSTTTHRAVDVDTCPRCYGRIEHSPRDAYCSNCGLVVDDEPIDRGPDWRSFADDDGNPERAAPGNPAHHDGGLGGTRPDQFGDQDEQRRNTINRRVESGSHKDRSHVYAVGEIHRVGVNAGLPTDAIERAKYVFRQYHRAKDLGGRDLDAIAGGSIYAAIRERQLGRTAEEVAEVARTDTQGVRRAVWEIADELSLELPPPSVEARIRVVGARVGVGPDGVADALERLASVEDRTGSPSVLAAACLWDSGACTQRDAADAAGVSTTAVRGRV